jgi:3-methyladenine DNA glycosylase AlkD
MSTAKEILEQLRSLGSEQHRKIYLNHGGKEPFFGVPIEDLKKIHRKIKNDQSLAMDLYKTGNSDAMYLAGMVADGSKMTKKELNTWAQSAPWGMISEYTVPWVASESEFGRELALEWIDSKNELVACSGWSTYSGMVATRPDTELDLKEVKSLLVRVQKTIHDAPNRVRYTMNGFVIAVGSYVPSLTDMAIEIGKKIGKVEVNLGNTACKVPSAPEYIQKVEERGSIGKKKKTNKCV